MKKMFLLTLVFLFVISMTSVAFADVAEFTGRWENIDSKTGGITNIEITREDDKIAVQIYGKCVPTDCVWKKSFAAVYAPKVESNLMSEAEALSIIYEPGFAQTIVTLQIIGENQLQADVFTRFTDRSNRTNTFHIETFAPKKDKPNVPPSKMQGGLLEGTDYASKTFQ
jgi:hypothetical protein